MWLIFPNKLNTNFVNSEIFHQLSLFLQKYIFFFFYSSTKRFLWRHWDKSNRLMDEKREIFLNIFLLCSCCSTLNFFFLSFPTVSLSLVRKLKRSCEREQQFGGKYFHCCRISLVYICEYPCNNQHHRTTESITK